jgi:hypothetical protein
LAIEVMNMSRFRSLTLASPYRPKKVKNHPGMKIVKYIYKHEVREIYCKDEALVGDFLLAISMDLEKKASELEFLFLESVSEDTMDMPLTEIGIFENAQDEDDVSNFYNLPEVMDFCGDWKSQDLYLDRALDIFFEKHFQKKNVLE